MTNWLNEHGNTLLPFIIATLAVSPLAVLSVIKLAEKIPYRMEKDWQNQLEEHCGQMHNDLDLKKYTLSTVQKASAGLLSLLITIYFFYTFGPTPASIGFCLYFHALLLLSVIDLKHMLFPDAIVLPMLWAGLIYHAIYETPSSEHVLGAAFGYVVPFFILHLIKMKTGKQVLGYGDLKVFAMTGAWLGASALPNIYMYFLLATFIGIAITIFNRRNFALPTAFCHAFASVNTYAGWTLWGG